MDRIIVYYYIHKSLGLFEKGTDRIIAEILFVFGIIKVYDCYGDNVGGEKWCVWYKFIMFHIISK